MKRNVFAMERRLDRQNRIVIPAEFRTALSWSTGTVIFVEFRPLRKEIVLGTRELLPTAEKVYARKFDTLGRVCVPMRFRRQLGLPKESILRIECDIATSEVRLTAPTG